MERLIATLALLVWSGVVSVVWDVGLASIEGIFSSIEGSSTSIEAVLILFGAVLLLLLEKTEEWLLRCSLRLLTLP